MDAEGALRCEGCGFDFAATYGELGHGFAECHHVVPLADLRAGSRTRLSDLVILCANCHRMIHRQGGLTIEELRTRLAQAGAT
jgi:5-methylcytosine-specific restriction protein A